MKQQELGLAGNVLGADCQDDNGKRVDCINKLLRL